MAPLPTSGVVGQDKLDRAGGFWWDKGEEKGKHFRARRAGGKPLDFLDKMD